MFDLTDHSSLKTIKLYYQESRMFCDRKDVSLESISNACIKVRPDLVLDLKYCMFAKTRERFSRKNHLNVLSIAKKPFFVLHCSQKERKKFRITVTYFLLLFSTVFLRHKLRNYNFFVFLCLK